MIMYQMSALNLSNKCVPMILTRGSFSMHLIRSAKCVLAKLYTSSQYNVHFLCHRLGNSNFTCALA